MQDYSVRLESPVATSFRCVNAANSMDIDVKKKSVHELKVSADIESDFNVGLIVGSSGSGKTTLARQIWGSDFEAKILDDAKPIIEQFPAHYSYDECASMLNSVGLSSVPCWIRPVYTLSNGQRFRAEIALRLSLQKDGETAIIDEWTSVVDRQVAKIMSHAVQKHARRFNKRIVLLSCHNDVFEWLNPDWVIDCSRQEYEERRFLWRSYERKERVVFDIRECDDKTWKYFSKYHYLSENLPGGLIFTFGLFMSGQQVGFQCFAEYVLRKKNRARTLHFNRTVIHPDYVGVGLGIKLIDETSAIMKKRGYRIMGKFSNAAVAASMSKDPRWALKSIQRFTPKLGNTGQRRSAQNAGHETRERQAVKTYSFEFLG